MVLGGAGTERTTHTASTWVAYACWLFGGIVGAHHFYLGDDLKALLFATTFGGVGVGWLRDLWCLPSYVRAINGPPDESQPVNTRRKSFFLMAGLFGVSYWLGRVATLALAPAWLAPVAWEIVVRSVACALGAYLVGHSSHHRTMTAPFWQLVLVSAAAQLAVAVLPNLDSYPWASYIPGASSTGALSAAAFAYRRRLFVPARTLVAASPRGIVRRVCVLFVCMAAFWALLVAAFAMNATMTLNGEPVVVAKHLHEFRSNSTAWRAVFVEWLLTLDELERVTVRGSERVKAYDVLGLKEGASMAQVKRRFRQLALELHPDRHDESERKEYERRFAAVQESYHALIERFGRVTSDGDADEL